MEDASTVVPTTTTTIAPTTLGKHRARVYEIWEGNERFFFWGYCMAGPNWVAVFGSAFMVLAPAGIFIAFVATWLLHHVQVAFMVFAALLPALSLVFLFMTACTDPGVIPRQEPDEEYLAGRKPRTKEVFVNNQRVLIRYNDTCHFYQPPRAHHCSVNDNCVERFDHHCPWVGTTVGRRNYRSFLLFIYTTTVLCLYTMACCLTQLFVKHQQLSRAAQAVGDTNSQWGATVKHVIPALALLGYTFLFVWFVGGLSAFHCYLVGSNQTTYENFRYNQDSRPNPYNRGCLTNCAEMWCLPVPASQVDFRAYADEAAKRPAAPPCLDAAMGSVAGAAGRPGSIGDGRPGSVGDGRPGSLQEVRTNSGRPGGGVVGEGRPGSSGRHAGGAAAAFAVGDGGNSGGLGRHHHAGSFGAHDAVFPGPGGVPPLQIVDAGHAV